MQIMYIYFINLKWLEQVTGKKLHIHNYIVLQCSKLFHSNVSRKFLWQHLQGSYSFAKIQNVGDSELSEGNV